MESTDNSYPTAIVTGKTAVNHARRVHFNMGLLHYVVMDHLIKMSNSSRPVTEIDLWVSIGVKSRQYAKAIQWLTANGFVVTAELNSVPVLTNKHCSTSNLTMEQMFQKFWSAETINGRSYRFIGSKSAAERHFNRVVKEVGYEYLMEQRKWYFRMISESDYRSPMMGATFLSKNDRRFEEDFRGQCKRIYDGALPSKKEKATKPVDLEDLFIEEEQK